MLWKVHQFQAFQFDYFILIWVFILFIFKLSFYEEGSYIYRLHFITLGIPSKFTNHHCIGILQICKLLEMAKALELRTTLWHFGSMWLFFLFLCCIIFFLFRRFSERITWEIKTINQKFSINFIKKIKLIK